MRARHPTGGLDHDGGWCDLSSASATLGRSSTSSHSARPARREVSALRELIVDLAMESPRMANAIRQLQEELRDGDPVPPELLRSAGEHVRHVGELMIGRAAYLESHSI